MGVLSPSSLEVCNYGTQGWNAIYSSNFEKLNDYLAKFEDLWNSTPADWDILRFDSSIVKWVKDTVENLSIQLETYLAKVDLSNVDDTTVLNKVKNVDGNGSGLDADLLDGKESSAFLDKTTYDSNDDGKVNAADFSDNSDKLDGFDASTSPSANVIPVTDDSGKLDKIWIKPILIKTITNNYTAEDSDDVLLVDASNNVITGENVGTGDVNTTTFYLDYPPVVDGTYTVYVDGSDANTITSSITGEIIGTGDGTTTSFSYTTLHTPLVAGNITITYTISGVTSSVTDDGSGNISDSNVNGTVDYNTGNISLNFITAPDSGSNITIDYSYYPYKYTLDINTGEIVFNEAPLTSSVITADYQSAKVVINLNSLDFPIRIKKIDSSSYTIEIIPNVGSIDGQSSITLQNQYESCTLIFDGSNWWKF